MDKLVSSHIRGQVDNPFRHKGQLLTYYHQENGKNHEPWDHEDAAVAAPAGSKNSCKIRFWLYLYTFSKSFTLAQ